MTGLPLRARLVAGFVVAMLVVLTGAGAFVYWRVQYALDSGLDRELDQATSTIAPIVPSSGRVAARQTADATGARWQVLDHDGRVVDSGSTVSDQPLVSATTLDTVGTNALTTDLGTLLPATAQPYRVQISTLSAGGRYLLVAVPRDRRDEALRELLLQLTLAGSAALAVAALVGDLLARAALRPVERYRVRASEIAGGAGDLRLEVPERRDDEVTRLGHTLNEMLAALQRSLEHERRFVNDASHELRTPLTLLTGRLQLARRRQRSVVEHETILDELLIDVARLSELAEDLLTLGAHGETGGSVDAVEITRALVDRRSLHGLDGVDQLRLFLPVRPADVAIAPRTAERILTNLVDNASLHGAAPIEIRIASQRPGWWCIKVSDGGPGMSSDLLTQATARFARSAEARTRRGAGLGLSIVEQLLNQSEGELRLCFNGSHSSHGNPHREISCDHDARMTATVILPAPSPGAK